MSCGNYLDNPQNRLLSADMVWGGMQTTSGENRPGRSAFTSHAREADYLEDDVPWATAAAWRECRLSLERSIDAAGSDLDPARAIARRIVHRYDLAGDLFDELEAASCGVCQRPCCLDARVWLDFKDLLLIHLSGQSPPPAQLRCNRKERCRYLATNGCTLPRGVRPWVCTWYVCPDQRRVLARDIPGGPERLARWWREIAALREQMEEAFVAVVIHQ